MGALRRLFFSIADLLRENILLVSLSFPVPRTNIVISSERPIIAGVTSYPGRLPHAWVAIECLLRQSVRPDRLILVLSEKEFPDKKLPWRLRAQIRRGLEILWVANNGKSFDKLIPLLRRHPKDIIITFDDDKYFPKNLIDRLVSAHREYPQHVVGARGWRIKSANSPPAVQYGVNWERARPGERGHHLFLPGGNGTLYPPGALSSTVTDLQRALKVCPTADDIWFWGHVQKQGTPMICLGLPPHRPVQRTSSGEALSTVNKGQNNVQLQAVMNILGIRETVERQVDSRA